jgi:hypothetical protein
MNKAQIKAELRRSATEDENLWLFGAGLDAFWAAGSFNVGRDEFIFALSFDDLRTFYLLVAEAL